MKIDITSLCFGFKITKENDSGTPAWATSIGQAPKGVCYVDTEREGLENLVYGMMYKSHSDFENLQVRNVVGVDKREEPRSDRERMMFSVFDDVYVNGIKLNGKYVLTFEREDSSSHKNRLHICYAKYLTYKGYSNKQTLSEMAQAIGCSEEACWFVSEIYVKNQSQLHFTAVIVNASKSMTYSDSKARKAAWDELLGNQSNTLSPQMFLPFITAIKSKPFLLLAGISGTGKSRIVRELAFMTCLEELQDEDGTTPGNYCMIEVKPNWHDSSELLGYYSSFNGGGYRFTKFDRFVVKAWLNPDVPFFVCLDEMNLAPVEQYFAEFLSVLETRSRDNEGNVVTGTLVDKQYFKDDTKMTEYFGLVNGDDWTIKVRSDLVNKGLTLPPNLIVIGTVNMDDTTYQFSRKVIDRAMTIEMNGGELSQMFGNCNSLKYRSDEDIVKLGMFKAPYINADEVIERYQSQANIIKEKLPEKLEAINTALKDTPFQVSYRVLNELVIYLGALMDEATAKGETIDDDALPTLINQAMDQITLMKILPRIEGDEDMFRRSGGTNVLKTLQSLFSEDSDSYKKLREMIDRLERTGFTRFWP